MTLREDFDPIGVVARLLKIFSQFIAIVPWQIHLTTRTNHRPLPPKRSRLRFSFPTTIAGGRNSPASCQALIRINHPNYL